MQLSILLAAFIGVGIFLILLTIIAFVFSDNKKSTIAPSSDDGWVFNDFTGRVYRVVFGNKNPEVEAQKLGFNISKYYDSCKITKTKPDARKVVVNYLYGIACLIASAILAYAVSIYFVIVGLVCFVAFAYSEQRVLDQRAKALRSQMENELPRFLDLLEAELAVGLPVETAIYLLCDKMKDTLIAQEFLSALNEMQLGLNGWDTALSSMAERYNVPTLTDFVLNLTTAYINGVSIIDTVKRKNKDTKEAHILMVEKEASKEENTVMIPMMIFQFIPMIVFVMFPTIVPIMSGVNFAF